jgi:hypothetical protein
MVKKVKEIPYQNSLIALCDIQIEYHKKQGKRYEGIGENIVFNGQTAYTHDRQKTLQSIDVLFITNTQNLAFCVNAMKLKQVLKVCDKPQLIVETQQNSNGYETPRLKIIDGLGVWTFPISSVNDIELFNESLPKIDNDILDTCQVSKNDLLYLVNNNLKITSQHFGVKYIQYYNQNQKPFITNANFGEFLNFGFDFKLYQTDVIFNLSELTKSKKTIESFNDIIDVKIKRNEYGNNSIIFNDVIEIVMDNLGFLGVENYLTFDKNQRQIKMTSQDIKNIKLQFKSNIEPQFEIKQFCLVSDNKHNLRTETKVYTKGIYNHYTKMVSFPLIDFTNSFKFDNQLHFYITDKDENNKRNGEYLQYVYTKTKNNTTAFCMCYDVEGKK